MQGTELVIPYFVFRSRYFRISINSSYVENYPDLSGFWCVAKV